MVLDALLVLILMTHIISLILTLCQDINTLNLQKKIEKNSRLSGVEVLTEYITQKDFEITPFTPYREYMIQKVSKIKSDLLGKAPKKLEDIKLDQLQEKYPDFTIEELHYQDKKEINSNVSSSTMNSWTNWQEELLFK